MGAAGPKPPNGRSELLRERLVQGALAVVVWWAVYYRVGPLYGQGGAIVAATCAAWGYVLVCAYAMHLLNRRSASANHPRGPQPPSGRWPGAPP